MDVSSTESASPLWRFSLQFYRMEGVEPACLLLQDAAGADVNVLLLLLWYARERRRLAASEIAEIERLCAPWRTAAVSPLRAVRRSLKTPPALVAAAEAASFRGKVKALELEAERLQQQAMYAWTQAAPRGRDAASPAAAAAAMLADYATVLGRSFPAAAVDTMGAALAASEKE